MRELKVLELTLPPPGRCAVTRQKIFLADRGIFSGGRRYSGSVRPLTTARMSSGGGSTGDVTLAIANGGIGAAMLANGAVAKAKLAASGGSNGQVLGTDGANLMWTTVSGGSLQLPYSGSASSSNGALAITNTGSGPGVTGSSGAGIGLLGGSTSGTGVFGGSTSGTGVRGESTSYSGVVGTTDSGEGVVGNSTSNNGVRGQTTGAGKSGVYGVNSSTAGFGVYGRNTANGSSGFLAGNTNDISTGVYGESSAANGAGVVGIASNGSGSVGVFGSSASGWAGFFSGNVQIVGSLSKSSGSFKIDHPLDPTGKYLYHSFVESPDMMDIYNGNVRTDADGYAVVQLPGYFEALNQDFRYQLTVIGQFAQAIVAEEIHDDRFVIRTNLGQVKVSWQVTGIRHDPWADANRIPVEQVKPKAEQGTYLVPEVYGQPESKGLSARMEELRRAAQGDAARQQ